MGSGAGGQGLDVDISFVDGREEVLCAVFGSDRESAWKLSRRNSDEGLREQRRTMSGRSVRS